MTTSEHNKEDYLNTLGLLYNERTHDAFIEAITDFVWDRFEDHIVVDRSEFRMIEADSQDAGYWENKYNEACNKADTLVSEIEELKALQR